MNDRYTMSKNPISNQLTPQQETAINLILAGKTDTEVAQTIGKSRSTVNIWRNHDPLFIATLNDRRQQVWDGQLNRLNTLAAEAVDALQDGLHDTDIKVRLAAAVHILKATGVYGTTAPGTQHTDPAEVAAAREVQEKERERRAGHEHWDWSSKEMEYRSRPTQESYFFAKEQTQQLLSETADAGRYFQLEADKEKVAYWEQLLPAFAEIPQERLDTLNDDVLRQLVLDFVQARDTYLKTLKEVLTHTANADRPVWDDYTKETAHQVEAEVERAKAKTEVALQVFLDAWERRGGDTEALLNQAKRKGRRKNPMLLQNRFKLPVHSDSQPPALSKPSDTDT